MVLWKTYVRSTFQNRDLHKIDISFMNFDQIVYVRYLCNVYIYSFHDIDNNQVHCIILFSLLNS